MAKRTWLAGLLTLSLAAAAAGCSSAQNSGTASPSPLAGEAVLQAALNDLVANQGPAGVMAVVQNGSTVAQLSAGVAETTNNQPMSAGAATRIASVSKAFNGAIILQLAANGKLALDSTIGSLLPTLPKAWSAATISQVLQHTSGIPDYIKDKTFLEQFIANPQMQRTPEQLIGYVAKKPLEFKPGSKYSYSDTDNIVAGLIAEKVTGVAYDQLLAQTITTPLGLTGTSLPSTSALPAGFIHGYDRDAQTGQLEDVSELINPGLAWASGGMVSTASDLNNFVRSLLAGKLFNPSVLTAPSAFVPGAGGPPGPGTNSSGLAIYRYETPCGVVYGHTGNMPGYTAFIASSPDGSNSVSFAVNGQISPSSNDAIYQKLVVAWNAAICSMYGTASPSPSAS